MRKLLLICLFISFFSCEKNETDDLLPIGAIAPIEVNLNLPQYNNLLTPTGWVYTAGGYKGVFIQTTKIATITEPATYIAYERACPNNDCNTPMTYDDFSNLICSCDKSEYSVYFGGSPQTTGNIYFAREYRVLVRTPTVLTITSF